MIDILLSGLLIMMTASCSEQAALYEYRDLPAEGWSRTDTLSFTTDTIAPGKYKVTLGLRYDTDYPYRNIILAVDADGELRQDTIYVADSIGNRKGYGLSGLYQYIYNIGVKEVPDSSVLHYNIYHKMDSILVGIDNVGMKIKLFQK